MKTNITNSPIGRDPITFTEYRKNVNLHMPDWLYYIIVIFSIFNLSITFLTFQFQIRRPKSRRNMGRFFLIILGLQTFDKVNILIQQLLMPDLSLPYFELKEGIHPQSVETQLCQYFGFTKTFVSFMSQFYALWFAMLIKQIIKDPIHKLQKYITFYHVITFVLSATLTGLLSLFNNFGVEECLQCGIMHTPGLDDEIFMLVPFLLLPIQLFLISKIIKETPFIVKESFKFFARKYLFYLLFLMSMQIMETVMILQGSRVQGYYSYEKEDGFKAFRYTYIIMDQVTYLCLAICTLMEPVFFEACRNFCQQRGWVRVKRNSNIELITPLSGQNSILRKGEDDGSDDDDIEGGDLQRDKDGYGVVDESKLKNFIGTGNIPSMKDMSLAKKTSYFIINSVLISICHCLIGEQQKDPEQSGVGGVLRKATKALTYQLNDNTDINHIMDLNEFYKKNTDLCVSDVTDGQKVLIKVIECGIDELKDIRKASGYSDDFLINSFSPYENVQQMVDFQEGSGKSSSFFFFTANSQFVIKTLKKSELKLLVREGLLEKYNQHLKANPKSMLVRFYGIYTVKIKYMKPISIIVMDNLMGKNTDEIHRIFDLKGSTYNRKTSSSKPHMSIRKDLNYLEEQQYRVVLNGDLKKDILERMNADKKFLQENQLMDYSLLLYFYKKPSTNGMLPMHNRSKSSMIVTFDENGEIVVKNKVEIEEDDQDIQPAIRENSLCFDKFQQSVDSSKLPQIINHKIVRSSICFNANKTEEFIHYKSEIDKNVYYRMGIIDFLQKYNLQKKAETKYLTLKNRNVAPESFSCVEPFTYGERFYNFMRTNLFGNPDTPWKFVLHDIVKEEVVSPTKSPQKISEDAMVKRSLSKLPTSLFTK